MRRPWRRATFHPCLCSFPAPTPAPAAAPGPARGRPKESKLLLRNEPWFSPCTKRCSPKRGPGIGRRTGPFLTRSVAVELVAAGEAQVRDVVGEKRPPGVRRTGFL